MASHIDFIMGRVYLDTSQPSQFRQPSASGSSYSQYQNTSFADFMPHLGFQPGIENGLKSEDTSYPPLGSPQSENPWSTASATSHSTSFDGTLPSLPQEAASPVPCQCTSVHYHCHECKKLFYYVGEYKYVPPLASKSVRLTSSQSSHAEPHQAPEMQLSRLR